MQKLIIDLLYTSLLAFKDITNRHKLAVVLYLIIFSSLHNSYAQKKPKIRNLSKETNSEYIKIIQSHKRALLLARKLEKEIEEIWEQKNSKKRKKAWKNNQDIVKWFGGDKVRNAQIRKMRRRTKKLRRKLDKWTVHYVYHKENKERAFLIKPCKSGSNRAFSFTWTPGVRIDICKAFFYYNKKERAGIIIHELVHEIRKSGNHFGVTKRDLRLKARKLAITQPKKARKSPRNYQYFIEKY